MSCRLLFANSSYCSFPVSLTLAEISLYACQQEPLKPKRLLSAATTKSAINKYLLSALLSNANVLLLALLDFVPKEKPRHSSPHARTPFMPNPTFCLFQTLLPQLLCSTLPSASPLRSTTEPHQRLPIQLFSQNQLSAPLSFLCSSFLPFYTGFLVFLPSSLLRTILSITLSVRSYSSRTQQR